MLDRRDKVVAVGTYTRNVSLALSLAPRDDLNRGAPNAIAITARLKIIVRALSREPRARGERLIVFRVPVNELK